MAPVSGGSDPTFATAHAAAVSALESVADQVGDDGRLDVRGTHVSVVCPAAAALDGDEFTASPATAAWGAASTTLDRLLHGHVDPRRGHPPDTPADAFRLAWDEREGIDDWPWPWLRAEATRADRAVVAANVQRRLSAMARLLPEWPPPAVGTVGHRPSWRFPGRGLRLVGRAELILGRRGRDHELVVVLGGDHGPATRARAAYEALVETLALHRPPARVLALLPDVGRRWPLTVDDDLLATGVEAAGLAARVALGARLLDAGALPRRPSSACRWCAHAEGCDPGRVWLAGPGRRRFGFA
jgi:hypothetical protein